MYDIILLHDHQQNCSYFFLNSLCFHTVYKIKLYHHLWSIFLIFVSIKSQLLSKQKTQHQPPDMVGSATGPVVGSATAATMAVAAVRQASGSAWTDRPASRVGEFAHHGMHGSAEDLLSNWNLFWKETCQRQVNSPTFEWNFLTNKNERILCT